MIFEIGKAYCALCDQGLAWMEEKRPLESPRRSMRIKEGQIVVCVGSIVDDRRMSFTRFLVGELTTGWVPLKEEFLVKVGEYFQEIP